jgi:hypothetical protein
LVGQSPATVAPAGVFVAYPDTRRHKRSTVAFTHRGIVQDVVLIVQTTGQFPSPSRDIGCIELGIEHSLCKGGGLRCQIQPLTKGIDFLYRQRLHVLEVIASG